MPRRRRLYGGASIAIPGGPAIDGPSASRGNLLQRARQYIKGRQLISKGLRAVGAKSLANKAAALGYGRRRRRRRRRRGGCKK